MSDVANQNKPPASVVQSAVPSGQTLKQTKVGEGDDETTVTYFNIQRFMNKHFIKNKDSEKQTNKTK